MAYQEYSSVNASEGIHVLFIYANDVTGGLFINLLLFALFIITMIGSFFASRRQTGQGDIAVSFAVSGYFVAGASILLSLIPNMVNTFTVVFCVAIAIVGSLVLYLNKSSET